MIFREEKAIYQQMADRLCDEIILGSYEEDTRVPSVREYAVQLEVNTNTAFKAFEQLARDEIIYNRRGMGYYVSPGARDKILTLRRAEFFNNTLPELRRQMNLLGLTFNDIIS